MQKDRSRTESRECRIHMCSYGSAAIVGPEPWHKFKFNGDAHNHVHIDYCRATHCAGFDPCAGRPSRLVLCS